jgi:hypothetical protein
MNAPVAKVKRNVMLLGLVFALVGVGASPLAGGHEADAAKRSRQRHQATEIGASASMVRRFENEERIRFWDAVGTTPGTSAIEVSGLTGPVIDVNVNLVDIYHGPESTQDIDVLLIGPVGKTALILSDVGGNTATAGVTLVLDDQQPEQLPSAAALTNGFFQPTNYGSPDIMNLGGGPITVPSGASLGAFNGIDPNGTWRLWVVDDEPNLSSRFGSSISGGWALTITTAGDQPSNGSTKAAPDRFKAKAGKMLRVNGSGVLRNDRDPDGDVLTAVLGRAPRKGKVVLNPDGSFTYRAHRKARGRDSFTYLARDERGSAARATVNIQIKPQKPQQGKGGRNGRR